jgi:hypothetical protein
MACGNIIKGSSGLVKVGAPLTIVGNAKSWSLNVTANSEQIHCFGSGSWAESIVTSKSYSVDIVVYFDADGVGETEIVSKLLAGEDIDFELSFSDGSQAMDTYTGSGIISNASWSVDSQGIVEASISIQGNGAIAIS